MEKQLYKALASLLFFLFSFLQAFEDFLANVGSYHTVPWQLPKKKVFFPLTVTEAMGSESFFLFSSTLQFPDKLTSWTSWTGGRNCKIYYVSKTHLPRGLLWFLLSSLIPFIKSSMRNIENKIKEKKRVSCPTNHHTRHIYQFWLDRRQRRRRQYSTPCLRFKLSVVLIHHCCQLQIYHSS